jgi:hypothetical protein
MKKENMWDEKAKSPDPDDLTAEGLAEFEPLQTAEADWSRSPRTGIDYTAMEHHEAIPDPRDTDDPSRPQGEFWHQNERPGAEAVKDVDLDKK